MPDPIQYAFRLGQCLYRKAKAERQAAADRAEKLLTVTVPGVTTQAAPALATTLPPEWICPVCQGRKRRADYVTCGNICGRIYRDKKRADAN